MKHGPQLAAAAAAGYLLGRTRKMKLAIMLAGMAAGRRVGSSPTDLLAQGAKLVGESPEINKLSGQLRDNLVEAGKGAVAAAAARQIDSVSDRLHSRSEALRADVSGGDSEGAGEATTDESTGKAARSSGSGARSSGSGKRSSGSGTRSQGQRKQAAGRTPREGKRDG